MCTQNYNHLLNILVLDLDYLVLDLDYLVLDLDYSLKYIFLRRGKTYKFQKLRNVRIFFTEIYV